MRGLRYLLPLLLPFASATALAQPTQVDEAADGEAAPQKDVIEELRELREMRSRMQQDMSRFDERIQAIENELGVAAPPVTEARSAADGIPAQPVEAAQREDDQESKGGGLAGYMERAEKGGRYEAGKGFLLVQEDEGELGAGVFAYARYLNQTGLNDTYVDSFGRTKTLADVRNDLQFQKLSWNFKGWLFDPNFRYYLFFWTSNPQMGEGAQVVLGGYFQYRFSDALIVTVGVMPLPTTRTTNYTFPNWLRNDNRIMADEFFRGSYSTGIDAQGEIARGLRYRVAVANNLAQLGSARRSWTPSSTRCPPPCGGCRPPANSDRRREWAISRITSSWRPWLARISPAAARMPRASRR